MFDFQFSNLSPVPSDAADTERLKRTSADLRRCNGCADALARKLGAEVAITGEVQKVSNLIINMNAYVKRLDRAEPERAYSVDQRGETDESFARGIRFLVEGNMGAGR